MYRLIRLALRNVLRNKWRSAVSSLALLVGVGAMVFLQGFLHGFIRSLIEDAVQARVGAVQLHRAGYLDAEQDPLTFDLPDDPAFIARLRAVPGVRAVSRRISFEGTLSNGNLSSIFAATAIDPRSEYEVCPRRRAFVAEGSTPLGSEAKSGILLGGTFAGGLGGAKGSTLIASSATQAGALNALDVTIHGLLPEANALENQRGLVVPLAFAQELLRMPGRVTEYVLDVDDLEDVDRVAAALRGTLGDGYQLSTWRDLQSIRDAIDRMGFVMGLIGFILALLVVSGIVNTVLMSVYERVREIGTMMAIGVRRRAVMMLFLVEAAALGLVSATLGAAIAVALIHQWSGGIHFPASAVSGVLVVVPHVGAPFLAGAVTVATLVAILASLYPAWKASRMRPVDALRSN